VRGVFEESLVRTMLLQPILNKKPVSTDLLLFDRYMTNFSSSMHLLLKEMT